jgi:molecular chaperone GrpE
MSDQPTGRPATPGAGANTDPAAHAPAVTPPADAPASPGRADGSIGFDGLTGDDNERASEVDDLTEGVSRPMSDAEAEQALADAIDDIDFSEVDVAAVLDERDQFKTMAQRVQADFDNFRKQSSVRAQADADRATGRLAEALLPVLDAAEAAFLRHPEEVGPLLNQMLVELKKQGLETLDLDGQPYDPEVAEAVAHEPSAGGEPIVAEVLRSG